MSKDFEPAAEEFLQQIGREHYENGAGLKDSLDVVPIYEQYAWLFERPVVDQLLERNDPEGRHLAEFAADGCLDAGVKELSEEITNEVTRATVEWQGEEIPYRRASVILANEPDQDRRHELESRIQARTKEQNPRRVERIERLHAEARDLGFQSYLEMYDRLKGLRLEWLQGKMEDLLERTEDIYAGELERFLGQIGVDKDAATPADVSFLFRAPEFDSLFPRQKLVPSLKKTLAGLGIDLDRQENVHLDTEPRPLKSPRAFCAPLRVPDEVYLVIAPKGGQDDYKAILHEAGHMEHFGHVSSDLPFAFRRLGDGAISESYAFIFDNLMRNGRWFAEVMGEHHVDDYLRLARFHKLWLLRRYAAKLRYECMLHVTDDITSMRGRYAEVLAKALRLKISQANFLADVDDALYATSYLRAWIFEVMLRKHLEDCYGALWFASSRAGEFLIGLWRKGQRFCVDELAHRLHYERLDAEPLVQEMAR